MSSQILAVRTQTHTLNSPIPTVVAGRFITVEGIDGAGKSSHLGALSAWLQAQGHAVVLTREPGGTALAEQLRSLFLHHTMDALTEALLVFAGRRDHLRSVIEPALARGAVVRCDRFTDATFAYQGGGRGFDAGVLTQLERWVQALPQDGTAISGTAISGTAMSGAAMSGTAISGSPPTLRQPDLTLWFDLPASVAAARRAAARPADRLEREDLAFFERVSAAYAARAQADPARFARIDASAALGAVRAQVLAAVQAHLMPPGGLHQGRAAHPAGR